MKTRVFKYMDMADDLAHFVKAGVAGKTAKNVGRSVRRRRRATGIKTEAAESIPQSVRRSSTSSRRESYSSAYNSAMNRVRPSLKKARIQRIKSLASQGALGRMGASFLTSYYNATALASQVIGHPLRSAAVLYGVALVNKTVDRTFNINLMSKTSEFLASPFVTDGSI